MKEFHGVQMLTTLEELVDPTHTALLIVGIQNDVCAPGGILVESGGDLEPFRSMIAATMKVLDAARAHGVPVVFVQNYLSTETTLGPWLECVFRNLDFLSEGDPALFVVAGTWGAETIDGLAPESSEAIVMAPRSSAFFQTNLDQILRSKGIKSLVCTGASTEGSLDSTVRDGLLHDYYTVVLEDCVASHRDELGELALLLLRSRTEITNSDEVIEIWRNGPKGQDDSMSDRQARVT